ncbi:MAG: cobalamin-dependent protein [Solirubrobacteraceae bacterium]
MPNESRDSHQAKISECGHAYARALLDGDEWAAEIAIREAIDARLTTGEIDEEIIAPALWLIGELWERNQLSVADEHLATEISIRMLALLREARRTILARGGHRVLLAAPPGEMHVVALTMTGDLLREAGYDTVMLGADVPARDLAGVAKRHRAEVICLTATLPDAVARAQRSIDEVRRQRPHAGFVLGGRGTSRGWPRQPLVERCERVSEVVDAVDAIVKRAALN